MQQKKKLSRKVISYVLALVMVFSTMTGIVPGMSLTAYAAGVSYIDGNGTPQNEEATELAENTTSWTDGSWYIVPAGGLTISGRITVNGTVNLILRDGATLTASAGITTTNATLNIYAQSTGTGALIATGKNGGAQEGGNAGIGGNGLGWGNSGGQGGTVNIYGGTVTATGGNGGANSGGGAGIGGGGLGWKSSGGQGGTVNIYGGTVTATGGNADQYAGGGAGIGGGGFGWSNGGTGYCTGGTVNIYGGTVIATGGNKFADRDSADGAGIGAGGKGYGSGTTTDGTLTLGKGVKLYNGTDNTGTVLDDSDSESRSYSESRVKTMFAEFISVGSVDKTALNNAIITATSISDDLTGDDYKLVKAALDTAITDAETVNEKDDATQDEVDAAVTALNSAVGEAQGTGAVIAQILSFDDSDITEDDETKISAITFAYDDLAGTAKNKVPDSVKNKLSAMNQKLNELKFASHKDSIEAQVENMKQDGDSNAATALITAAKAAIDALTYDTGKSLAENRAAVDAIRNKLETDLNYQRTAEPVITMIDALPASDKVATTDKEAIEAARKAYEALEEGPKSKVTPENITKLEAAEKALEEAEKKDAADTEAADKVTKSINALPASDKVAITDKAVIEAARKAYDTLTADQKKKVSADTLKKLTDAEAALKAATVADKAAKELVAAKEEAQAAMNEQVTVTQKGKKFTVKWKKSTSADGYYVYASYCGKKATKPAKGN